jgi:hypothetical protein
MIDHAQPLVLLIGGLVALLALLWTCREGRRR